MVASRLEGDHYVNGNLNSKTLTIPPGTIVNAGIGAAAAIATSKMLHRHVIQYHQEDGANIADTTGEGDPIHLCRVATTLLAIEATWVDGSSGTGTCTIDLKYANDDPTAPTTCLTGVITLDNGVSNYEPVAGTLAVTAFVAGDVLMIVVDETDGDSAPQGLIVTVTLDEAAA